MSKERILELIKKLLEQVQDEHGAIPKIVVDDVVAWVDAMVEAHVKK